ncbi:unnamed protein product [Wuchereria bancrofti]|uniref:Uncharacterized protein n=1 Tax=Wuchereria bancrofti TaxID=6293 RepID=A0A3P7E065_WUCBA|nr:unnamed protein product [Wuchereria bancrofti]
MDIMAADENKITDDDTKNCSNLKAFRFKEILGEDPTRKVKLFFLQ